jgi:hypothetical protein
MRLTETAVDGAVFHSWTSIATNVPCRLDLGFSRPTSDVVIAPEAGRGPDRAGTLFIMPDVDIAYGDRLVITFPAKLAGIHVAIDGSIDPAINAGGVSHYEINVHEVAKALT